jgi:hypothetical protein
VTAFFAPIEPWQRAVIAGLACALGGPSVTPRTAAFASAGGAVAALLPREAVTLLLGEDSVARSLAAGLLLRAAWEGRAHRGFAFACAVLALPNLLPGPGVAMPGASALGHLGPLLLLAAVATRPILALRWGLPALPAGARLDLVGLVVGSALTGALVTEDAADSMFRLAGAAYSLALVSRPRSAPEVQATPVA